WSSDVCSSDLAIVFPRKPSLHMQLQPIHLSLSAAFRIPSNARSPTPCRGSQGLERCGPGRESTGITPFHEATPRNAPDCAALSLVGSERPTDSDRCLKLRARERAPLHPFP